MAFAGVVEPPGPAGPAGPLACFSGTLAAVALCDADPPRADADPEPDGPLACFSGTLTAAARCDADADAGPGADADPSADATPPRPELDVGDLSTRPTDPGLVLFITFVPLLVAVSLVLFVPAFVALSVAIFAFLLVVQMGWDDVVARALGVLIVALTMPLACIFVPVALIGSTLVSLVEVLWCLAQGRPVSEVRWLWQDEYEF